MQRSVHSLGARLGSVSWRYRMPLGQAGEQRRGPVRRALPASEGALDDDLPHPTRRPERLARVEAVLLLSREPLASRKLAQLANLADGTEARTLIGRLNRMYDGRRTAFRVEEVAGGFQLLTRAAFGAWLRRIHQSSGETRLSGPAMETLAVVAYRQPVLRADIEAIRGVQCGEMLRQLMERDLVRIVGRADELGRPLLYGTTKRFLQVFGLRHPDDLPRADQLRVAPEPSPRETDGEVDTKADSDDREEPNVSVTIRSRKPRPEAAEELGLTSSDETRRPFPTSPVASFDDEDDDEEFEDDEEEDEDYDEEDDEEEDVEDGEWEEVDDDEEDEEDEEDDEEWDEEDDEEWDEDDEEEDDDEWEDDEEE